MNDPRFTAYALGELEAPERETFEHELASSEELQAELKEMIALAEALPASLDSGDTLTDVQRGSLRLRCADNRRALRRERVARQRMAAFSIGALAAGLAIAGIILWEKHESPPPTIEQPVAVAAQIPQSNPTTGTTSVVVSRPSSGVAVTSPAPAASFTPRLEGTEHLGEASNSMTLAMNLDRRDATYGLPESPRTGTLPDLEKDGLLSVPPDQAESAPRAGAIFGGGLASADANATSHLFREASRKQDKSPEFAAESAAKNGTRLATFSGDIPFSGRLFRSSVSQQFKSNPILFPTGDLIAPSAGQPISGPNDETYAPIHSTPFLDARTNPLSTFSIDVDTGSYANVRRFLTNGQLPPPDAVRIEELLNYFPYAYPNPEGNAPFSVNTEVSRAPWDSGLLLARVALKGRDLSEDKLPLSNFVFLIDVSGSMASENKLPLLKRCLALLVDKLSPADHVAIVTYAGESGVALPSTSGEDKARIVSAIEGLEAGGSTNGAAGIALAYQIAGENAVEGGNNRVILCTDGDFNVGVTTMDGLTRLIENERKSHVFLSVLGLGTDNLKDATMETLADKGNGNYAYVDTLAEGRKVLVDQMRANLFTIAKDVKIQVEFNPATVAGYRLIGYEKRLLAKEDFNNDRKDAGEIGAGHTVTAFYEIVPVGHSVPGGVDPLKYQTPAEAAQKPVHGEAAPSTDLFTVKLRYKAPNGDQSQLIEKSVGPAAGDFDHASEDFRFAAAVAAFGMKLRQDDGDPALDWTTIQKIARGSMGEDPSTYRAEFLTLIQKAKQLSPEEK